MTRSRVFIRREGGEKEEEGSNGDDDDGNDAGEGEEREGAAYLVDASAVNRIFGTIASVKVTTTTNAKASKDNDDKEGPMMG